MDGSLNNWSLGLPRTLDNMDILGAEVDQNLLSIDFIQSNIIHPLVMAKDCTQGNVQCSGTGGSFADRSDEIR